MSLVGDLDKLVSAIISKAEEEAKSVVAKARERAEGIIKGAIEEAKAKAERDASELVKRRRSEALSRRRSEVAKARTEVLRKLQDHKERLIEGVVEEVKRRVQRLVESKEYEERLVEMIKEAVRVLGGGTIEVKLNKRDAGLGLDLTAIASELSRELGKSVELKLSSEPGGFMGGLVARSLEAGIEVDYTIEGILERKWRKLRSEVAKLLFSET
jgi:V/A-type H+-transporting ATPase subunit E